MAPAATLAIGHDQEKPDNPPQAHRHFLIRGGSFALAASAALALLLASVERNDAAACRGSGVTTVNADGSTTTLWSDGAYVRQNADGSQEWAYPSGSDPVPGASPGHRPRP